ncbi:hypothetical protein SDC9_183129 [bioreactor metagenome]|uniref:Uncharacterized protein n=1 Tax=bioreactor metagenome TaxID=1076179 RepID=A0A645H9E4_9ZZZZ
MQGFLHRDAVGRRIFRFVHLVTDMHFDGAHQPGFFVHRLKDGFHKVRDCRLSVCPCDADDFHRFTRITIKVIRKQTHRFTRIRNIDNRDIRCRFLNILVGNNHTRTVGDRCLYVIVAIHLRPVDADKQIP